MSPSHQQPVNLALDPPGAIVPPIDRQRLQILLNRFPLKQGWDSLALGQIMARRDLSMAQKFSCLKFYFDQGEMNNLFATLTRSGSHWSILGLTIAKDLAEGGDGDYWLAHEEWRLRYGIRYLKFDWRVPTGEVFDESRWGTPIHDPILYHSHLPYFRIRSAQLKKMKIIIVLRSIRESIESKFFKLGQVPDQPDAKDEENFMWSALINDTIKFYNSWGDVIRWHPNCRVYKYEELLADPVGVHKEMADFWDLNIPQSCIKDAFDSVTKEKMKVKIAEAGAKHQTRVSYRPKTSEIPQHRKDQIDQLISERLVYDFGYGYG